MILWFLVSLVITTILNFIMNIVILTPMMGIRGVFRFTTWSLRYSLAAFIITFIIAYSLYPVSASPIFNIFADRKLVMKYGPPTYDFWGNDYYIGAPGARYF